MKEVNHKIIFVRRFFKIQIYLYRKLIFNDIKLTNLLKFSIVSFAPTAPISL